MADDIDRAKELEMQQRQIALNNQLERAKETEEPLVICGKRRCIDCREPIEKARLEARPESVRCIFCKELKEYKERQRA